MEAIQRKNVSISVIKTKLATLHHVQGQVTVTCHSIVLEKVGVVRGGLDTESRHTKVCPYFMLNKYVFDKNSVHYAELKFHLKILLFLVACVKDSDCGGSTPRCIYPGLDSSKCGTCTFS